MIFCELTVIIFLPIKPELDLARSKFGTIFKIRARLQKHLGLGFDVSWSCCLQYNFRFFLGTISLTERKSN